MQLTLLHFNDLHGRLEQMPRLFQLARRERAAAQAQGQQVLLLDGGDSSDSGRWECAVTQGRANYSLLEAMGVQAGVPGNAETLNWGRPALAKMVAAVGFPGVASHLGDGPDPARPAAPALKGPVLLGPGAVPLGPGRADPAFPHASSRSAFR